MLSRSVAQAVFEPAIEGDDACLSMAAHVLMEMQRIELAFTSTAVLHVLDRGAGATT